MMALYRRDVSVSEHFGLVCPPCYGESHLWNSLCSSGGLLSCMLPGTSTSYGVGYSPSASLSRACLHMPRRHFFSFDCTISRHTIWPYGLSHCRGNQPQRVGVLLRVLYGARYATALLRNCESSMRQRRRTYGLSIHAGIFCCVFLLVIRIK